MPRMRQLGISTFLTRKNIYTILGLLKRIDGLSRDGLNRENRK